MMEDERVVMVFSRTGQVTAEFLLKALFMFGDFAVKMQQGYQMNKLFSGETSWHKFMASLGEKEIINLQQSEVNFDKLKSELEKYHIGFAFHKHSDNDMMSLAYDVKNKSILKDIFTRIIYDITHDKKILTSIKKEAHEQTLDKKLDYYRKEVTNKVLSSDLNKAEGSQIQSVVKDSMPLTQQLTKGKG